MTAPLSHPKVLFLDPDTWAEWQKYIRSDSQRKGKAFWNGLHYSTWQDSGTGPVFWTEPWTFGGLQGRRAVSCDGNMKYDGRLEFDRKQRWAKCKQEDSDERKQADEKGSISSSTLEVCVRSCALQVCCFWAVCRYRWARPIARVFAYVPFPGLCIYVYNRVYFLWLVRSGVCGLLCTPMWVAGCLW